jgi:CCR4-NOT transcription complex subunit 1
VQNRRKSREAGFYDLSLMANGRYPSALPEPLRPKAGGLVGSQMEVYEAFQRTPRTVPRASAQTGTQGGLGAGIGGVSLVSQSPVMAPQPSQAAPVQSLSSPPPPQQQAQVPLAKVVAGEGNSSPSFQQVLELFETYIQRMDATIQNVLLHNSAPGREISLSMVGPEHEIRALIRELVLLPKRVASPVREEVAMRAAQTIFKMLYDGSSAELIRVEALVSVMEGMCDVFKKIRSDLFAWLAYVNMTEANRRLHRNVLVAFIKAKLLKTTEIDIHLAKHMDAGRNAFWIDFSIILVRQIVIVDRLAPYQELSNTLDILQKSAPRQQPNTRKEISRLVEDLRQTADAQAKQQQPHVAKAPIRMGPAQRQERQDVTYLLEHWIVIWNESPGSENAYGQYFKMLQQHEVTKSHEQIEKFIRIATEVCVEACLKNAVVNDNDDLHRTTLSYTIVDAYAKLLYLLVKYNGDATSRVQVLQRILKAVVASLKEDFELRKAPSMAFDPRPYFRLFVDLLHDFNALDLSLDANIQILMAFGHAFHGLQPVVVPPFAFAWLELISHRMFMPTLLLAKGQKGWAMMHRLLLDLFSFMEPFLRKAELNDPIRILYKGTLRVLLVLLHDFPEFLCDYHFSFCDVIPPTCIQLRNLILSAFPRNMRLPDPFTPNLKVDLLPDIRQPPRILASYTAALSVGSPSLKQEVDAYLKTRQPINFLVELPRRLRVKAAENQAYNVPGMNALVIYVGMQAIAQFQVKAASTLPVAHSAPMDIFQSLVNNLEPEGRYLFLNAIANQLRYPNNQTHYFSCVLLYLFAEAREDIVKEQITRVLLERLIVHRPHPVRRPVSPGADKHVSIVVTLLSLWLQWGLLITFIELIKNPRYHFWQHQFTRCAPEIERVFESVARSCMGQGGHVPTAGAKGTEDTLANS